jgi:hypothetical protein
MNRKDTKKSQESGIRNQESGIRNQALQAEGSAKAWIRNQESEGGN